MRTYDVRILSVKMIKGIAPRKSILSRNIVHKYKWLQISPMPKTFGEAIETSRNKKKKLRNKIASKR